MTRPTAIDLFCGRGGISEGLRLAGFDVLAGVDVEETYHRTFQRNFPESSCLNLDLSSTAPCLVMDRVGIAPGELDLLAGGPPCQGFSKNVPRRQRAADAANNRLVNTFLDYVEALQPRFVLMENVAEMKNGFDQAYTRSVEARLASAGYAVTHGVLNAADHGIPQRRRRAFFLAHREGVALNLPAPTHRPPDDGPFLLVDSPSHVSVWEAIGDLPGLADEPDHEATRYTLPPSSDYQIKVRAGSGDSLANHRARKLQPLQFQRLASLAPGQGIKDLPPEIRPNSGYSGAYGRLTKTMVAPTITRWVFHPGSGRYGHPVETRVITIREAARLQGFPDAFEFVGSYLQQAGQVGNAVPPLLIEQIAAGFRRQAGGGLKLASSAVNCS